MGEEMVHIEAFDCLPFTSETATAEVLQEFIETQTGNVFWFSAGYLQDDEARLAEYDYRKKQWVAGRFVGEAMFNHRGTDYKITIKPRFGERVLLRMLEEIFNIRITSSTSHHKTGEDWQHFIKRIIAYIWIQRLANANLHGVPKVQVKVDHKGQKIRGRLDVRKSLKPLHLTNEVVSTYRDKHIDVKIAQILNQAYQILKSDFEIAGVNIPDSAQEAINQVSSTILNREYISEADYKSIRYKEIYLSWQPIVDLSWDIIKRKQISLKQNKAKNGFGFFIDMAEVWEQYLRSILKKNLAPYGWHSRNDKQIAYDGLFFRRELIPDLVFQKGDEIAVWDAKYKRMLGRGFDVDRADFFQIHTYIQNFLNHKKVKAGGLLYPILAKNTDFYKYKSPCLMNDEGFQLNFMIDGLQIEESEENNSIQSKESEFIVRILESIEE
jgi:5-methylcytosine-specific restriction enzyme subunit McrC